MSQGSRTSQRHRGGHPGHARGAPVVRVGGFCGHQPRAHAVDPDLRRPLDGQGLGQVDQAGFGRPVCGGTRGRAIPLTDEMLTMDPPSSCPCITALAAWAQYMGASRFSATIDARKRGEATAASTWGEPRRC